MAISLDNCDIFRGISRTDNSAALINDDGIMEILDLVITESNLSVSTTALGVMGYRLKCSTDYAIIVCRLRFSCLEMQPQLLQAA